MKHTKSNEEESIIQENDVDVIVDDDPTLYKHEKDVIFSSDEDEVKQDDKTAGKAFSRMFKFLFVGTFTGLLALGSFTLFMYIYDTLIISTQYRPLAILVSEYLSVLFSCCLSFMLNSKFTFSDRKARRAGLALYVLYYVISTGLGSLLIIALNNKGLDLALAKLIKMTINLVLDFLYSRFFIFRYLKSRYRVSREELISPPMPRDKD